jgi:adenylate cyclase
MAAVELSRETVPWQPVAGIAELYEGATEASKAQKRLQVLLSFSAALSRPQQLEANLKQIVEFVLQTTDVDRAALYLLKTPWVPGEPVEFRHRSQQTRTESVPVEPSMTVMTKVLETEQGLLIRDAQMNTQMAASASMLMQKIRTCICLPLKTPDRLLGVLYADAPRPLVLNEQDDVDFFSAFAALAAVALENNLLLQQVRREAVNRARFERFFPPNTLEAVLSGGDRLAGREQDVTVMFCDIRNYTEMSAKRNPREVAGLLNRYFQTLVPIVFRRNGTLEKYIGDALVAIWGAPVATPKVHQAGSACMAALDIQAAIAQLIATPISPSRLALASTTVAPTSGPSATTATCNTLPSVPPPTCRPASAGIPPLARCWSHARWPTCSAARHSRSAPRAPSKPRVSMTLSRSSE